MQREWRYSSAVNLEDLAIPDWSLPGGALSPELMAVVYTRGFKNEDEVAAFLMPERYQPALPTELPGMEKAIRTIRRLRPGDKILIWGDFDVDGMTSTAMLVEGLQKIGFDVVAHIPQRIEGHGVHLDSLRDIIAENEPALVLICDTGSDAVDEMEYLRDRDILTIVADHHDISPPLPRADAIINPQLLREGTHPLSHLSGAGVCYLFLEALFLEYGNKREAEKFLDLAALGLIADVVRQVDDVRYLIQRGLRALQRTERVGLQALATQLDIELANLTSKDVAFTFAPAINAFGRLDDAALGLELLSTRDTTRAQYLAGVADSLNQKRKMMTQQITDSAEQMISDNPTLVEEWEALVLHSPGWDGSMLGPVAARLADKYQKPVALLVEKENGIASGSVRSVDGYPVNDALKVLDDVLISYGGHEGAGGMSLHMDELPALRRRLSNAFASVRQPGADTALMVEGLLPLERLTLDFALEVQRLAPFGSGNDAPVFVTRDLEMRSVAKLGRNDQHRRLIVENRDGQRQHVFWWSSSDLDLPDRRFDLAYTLNVSTFKGERQMQIELVDFHLLAGGDATPESVLEILDYRYVDNIQAILDEIYARDAGAIVWAEGFSTSNSPGLTFSELAEADALIILSAPAEPSQIEKAVEKVKPHRIYLVAVDPPVNTLPDFLKMLYGLASKVIEDAGGTVNIQKLMERLAQSRAVIQLGLHYLDALGKIRVEFGERTRIDLERGDGIPSTEVEAVERRLRSAWEEVETYRRYLRRVDIDQLLRGME